MKASSKPLSMEEAIDVFVRGFCVTKSATRPYICERLGPLWIMRDSPGRRNPRKVEIVASGLSPVAVKEQIEAQQVGWHFLCHIHDLETDYEAIRNGYKALGYRALSTEGFFVHNLRDLPDCESRPPVRLVRSEEEAASIPHEGPRNRYLPRTRLFTIWDEERDYGWVRSVTVGRNAWVSGLYVRREYRGKGYGRALMGSLLHSDSEQLLDHSVLLASTDGARLYPHLGYQKIGILQMFCPAKRF